MDYCRMQPCSVRALGDTELGIPELVRICRTASPRTAPQEEDRGPQGRDRQAPRRGLGEVAAGAEQELGRLPDHLPAARDGSLGGDQGRRLGAHRQRSEAEVRKLWDFDKPYRHPGVELGTSTQIGISLGVAMARKDQAGSLSISIPTAT